MATFDEQYYLNCVDQGIRLYWRTLGQARDMVIRTGDIEYVMSKSRSGPERIFSVHLSADTVDQRIQEIVTDIKAGIIPDSFIITQNSTPAHIADRLAQNGFHLDQSVPCMVMDIADLGDARPQSDRIQIVLVEDVHTLRTWVDIVNTALFECEIMSFEQFHDLYSLMNTRCFLALYDNIPAAVSMIIMDGTIATLEFVAAHKEYRHRGLGSAVTFAALHYAQANHVKTISLRAEPDAIRLYQKVGFREICKRIVASYVG